MGIEESIRPINSQQLLTHSMTAARPDVLKLKTRLDEYGFVVVEQLLDADVTRQLADSMNRVFENMLRRTSRISTSAECWSSYRRAICRLSKQHCSTRCVSAWRSAFLGTIFDWPKSGSAVSSRCRRTFATRGGAG